MSSDLSRDVMGWRMENADLLLNILDYLLAYG